MGGKRRYGLCGSARESWSFSAFAFHDERWTAGSRSHVKVQFSRHHRQLRSRYELSLGMHLRDQIGLGVTPSKVPHWTAFLSMLIGLFYNKTFRQKLEYLLEQISEVWLLPHWLDLANVEVLAADNTRVPLYMLMVAVHKELDSDDVPDGRFDILLCRDSSREVGE
ncbi:CFA_G0034330.mRNA.1.CDS.1 [Saccharomyces cerevisiae]|nr:CFA_G0034330.mRNA.1.CDS.1 [Saccharomyces cerevisiae]CAI7395902.1 CFA_G0034330.mRNA.1.CDS.1 [Saccharomyces cerevisiae]